MVFMLLGATANSSNGRYQLACGEEECFILNVDNGVAKMLVKGPKDDDDWEDDKKYSCINLGNQRISSNSTKLADPPYRDG